MWERCYNDQGRMDPARAVACRDAFKAAGLYKPPKRRTTTTQRQLQEQHNRDVDRQRRAEERRNRRRPRDHTDGQPPVQPAPALRASTTITPDERTSTDHRRQSWMFMTVIRATLGLPPTNVHNSLVTNWENMYGAGSWQQHLDICRPHVLHVINTAGPITWQIHNVYANADNQLRVLDPAFSAPHVNLIPYYQALLFDMRNPNPPLIWGAWQRMINFADRFYGAGVAVYDFRL
jgi:hypothetical protein